MRPIKFRGRVVAHHKTDAGKIVYGFYEKTSTSELFPLHWIKSSACDLTQLWCVDPESIAQLVGVDSNGREVYEGDILLDELEQEHVAEIYDRPSKISALTLKEAQS